MEMLQGRDLQGKKPKANCAHKQKNPLVSGKKTILPWKEITLA